MTFEGWMRYRGLSESSVKKYSGAISGPMSDWAIQAGLLEGPLTSIQSLGQFKLIAMSLQELSIYRMRNQRGHNMYSSALNKYKEYLGEGFDSDLASDIEEIFFRPGIAETEKMLLLKARIGQGGFRQKLVALWGGCAVTGYKDASMLVASHIKPWRAASHHERLDQYNGLLLLPTLDKAFDSGFISFDEGGRILISSLLEAPAQLGVSNSMTINLMPQHFGYMSFHRENVFREGLK